MRHDQFVGAQAVATQEQPATKLLLDRMEALDQAAATSARVEWAGSASPEGSLLGRIEIKAVSLSAIILEGVEEEALRHAVGHIPGTPPPGQRGNIVLAAHRDTFFRGLRNIQVKDEIILTTTSRKARYRVVATQVVKPEDITVLADSTEDVLTLVTCCPFTFVGAAPKRYIVRAEKIL